MKNDASAILARLRAKNQQANQIAAGSVSHAKIAMQEEPVPDTVNLVGSKGVPIAHLHCLNHDPAVVRALFANALRVVAWRPEPWDEMFRWCEENVKEFFVFDESRNVLYFLTETERARALVEMQGKQLEPRF